MLLWVFEHLEERESSFEEDSETNLLIKSKSNFSARKLSVLVKGEDDKTGGEKEPCFSLVTHSVRVVTAPETTEGLEPQEAETDPGSPRSQSRL